MGGLGRKSLRAQHSSEKALARPVVEPWNKDYLLRTPVLGRKGPTLILLPGSDSGGEQPGESVASADPEDVATGSVNKYTLCRRFSLEGGSEWHSPMAAQWERRTHSLDRKQIN